MTEVKHNEEVSTLSLRSPSRDYDTIQESIIFRDDHVSWMLDILSEPVNMAPFDDLFNTEISLLKAKHPVFFLDPSDFMEACVVEGETMWPHDVSFEQNEEHLAEKSELVDTVGELTHKDKTSSKKKKRKSKSGSVKNKEKDSSASTPSTPTSHAKARAQFSDVLDSTTDDSISVQGGQLRSLDDTPTRERRLNKTKSLDYR